MNMLGHYQVYLSNIKHEIENYTVYKISVSPFPAWPVMLGFLMATECIEASFKYLVPSSQRTLMCVVLTSSTGVSARQQNNESYCLYYSNK
jgi:hypothetical protein